MKIFLSVGCMVMLLCGCVRVFAQDAHFSQFYAMPVLRNPALTGLFPEDIRGTVGYRDQWSPINVPYKTMALGAEFNVPVLPGENHWIKESFGLQITHDVAGDSKLSKTQLMPAMNLHFPLSPYSDNNSQLSVGITGSMVLNSFNTKDLQFDDQFVNSPVLAPSRQAFNTTQRTYFNGLGLGVVYNYGNYELDEVRYYAGASIVNYQFARKQKYFQDSYVDSARSYRIGVNAGGTYPTGEDSRLNVYADYFRQARNNLVQFGAMMTFDCPSWDLALTGGLVCRWDDALVPVVNLEYRNLFIGLSYDANINNRLVIAGRTKNVFELMLSYKGFLNILDRQYRCPDRPAQTQVW